VKARIGTTLAVVAVAIVSVNLRPGASSVGPVLEEVSDGLSMSPTVAGLLTGLPGLVFGLVGALAVAIGRRVGTSVGIALGAVVVVVGLVARSLTGSTVVFLALSALALAGMAVGNVLVPAWIKAHADTGVVLPTVYGTGLIVGGTVGSAFTAPVAAASDSWRWALGMWGLAALLALPVWGWLSLRERSTAPVTRRAPVRIGVRRSPTAVAMAALFGVQSMHAYVQFGWLPQIYRDAGLSSSQSGALMAVVAGIGIVGALLMPSVIMRTRALATWMVGFGVVLALGYVGLVLAPATVPWLWALLLGVAGWAFPTSLALLTARTRSSEVTAALSGFVQPVGYAFAALGPFLVGLVHQVTGDWDLVLVALLLTAVPFTWAGVRSAREVWIEDELARG
jgi:CP family cyanate transporter-like MFS transporter